MDTPIATTTTTFSATYDFATDSINFNNITPTQVFENISLKLESFVKEVSTASDEAVTLRIDKIYTVNNQIEFLSQIKQLISVISEKNLISGISQDDIENKFSNFYNLVENNDFNIAYTQNLNYIFDNDGDFNSFNNSSVIIGGAGDDTLVGLKGNDVYL